MPLDKLDLKLMEELEGDARQPVGALAKKLGVKRTTVSYRLKRLRDENIMTIACVSDPEVLGYQFQLLMGLNVSTGKAGIVANQLVPSPVVKVVFLAVGNYDVLVWALFRDQASLTHFVSEVLPGISDITSIELMHFYHWVRDSWTYFKPQIETICKSPQYKLSDFDLSIVEAMQQNPRQTITQLAETVGCSIPMAKKSLENLVNDGIIRFTSIIDTAALGYNIRVVILIKCKPDKIYAVASKLSKQDSARYVGLVIGQWQIFFGAVFRDSRHMYSFLSEKLTFIPGIAEYQVVFIGATLKYSFGLTGPAIISRYSEKDSETRL